MDFARWTRKSIRFPLAEPVVFWWQVENGAHQQSTGRIRDISERGAFVFAADCPPVGADVKLRISLAALPGGAQALQVEVEGQVLRIDKPNSDMRSSGFAVLTKEAFLKTRGESDEEGVCDGSEATGN